MKNYKPFLYLSILLFALAGVLYLIHSNDFLGLALALAFLFGLIGFLVYKQQRLKNEQIIKENELRQALIKIENQNNLQEQRLAISKDLHDNIGSQLTFIISSLDNLKYFEFTKDKLYSKFVKDDINKNNDGIIPKRVDQKKLDILTLNIHGRIFCIWNGIPPTNL